MHGERVDGGVFVDTGVAFAAVEGASKCGREFVDQAVVWKAEVAELQGEADEVGEEVGCVDTAVDEDGAVDVGVRKGGEG